MSTLEPPQTPIPPLTSKKANGKPQERPQAVEAQIREMSVLPQSERLAAVPKLKNEVIVNLIRESRRSGEELYIRLFQELSRRILWLAAPRVCRLAPGTADEIVMKVEIEIVILVLAEKPTRESDFLEIAFAQAVGSHTVDAIRRHNNFPMGQRVEFRPGATDEDDDEVTLAVDHRPNPEERLLHLEEGNHRHQLLQTACDAIPDRRQLEAVILYYAHDWPIISTDPKKASLVRRFRKTEGQIKYWLITGMKAMRDALGVEREAQARAERKPGRAQPEEKDEALTIGGAK